MVPAKPGIAFVEYSDEGQAGVAMQGLQGFKLATGAWPGGCRERAWRALRWHAMRCQALAACASPGPTFPCLVCVPTLPARSAHADKPMAISFANRQ